MCHSKFQELQPGEIAERVCSCGTILSDPLKTIELLGKAIIHL